MDITVRRARIKEEYYSTGGFTPVWGGGAETWPLQRVTEIGNTTDRKINVGQITPIDAEYGAFNSEMNWSFGVSKTSLFGDNCFVVAKGEDLVTSPYLGIDTTEGTVHLYQKLKFTNQTSTIPNEGEIGYSGQKTLVIGNDKGVRLESVFTAGERYVAEEPILKGQTLYISGFISPGLIGVKLAVNDAYNENWTVGIAANDAAAGELVYMFQRGLIEGVDTSGLQVDVPLYIGNTRGGITDQRPVFPSIPYIVGTVVVSDSVNGVIGVGGQQDLYDQTYDGCVIERQDSELRFEGGKVYFDIEKLGGGDLPVQLGSYTYLFDCTTGAGAGGKGTVELIQGTASTLSHNMIYFHLVGGVLTLSTTTGYPSGAFAQVGYVTLKDYTTSSTYGPILTRRITSAKNHSGRGRVSYVMERSTVQGVKYWTGMQPSATITPGTPDIVNVTTLEGYFYQNHRQYWPPVDLGLTGAIVLNASGLGDLTPNQIVYNLSECDELADGSPVNNRRMHLTIVGLGNGKDLDKRYGILLPNGDYGNSDTEAYKDYNNTATTTVPDEVRLTAMLIARIPLKFSSGGNTAEFINPVGSPEIVTLLGLPLGYTSTGGVGGASFIPTLEQVVSIGATSSVKMAYTVQQAFSEPFDIIDKGYADTKMNYRKNWQPVEYYANDVVYDGDWTMVANTTTFDRAAPQPYGEPISEFEGGGTFTTQTITDQSVVVVGQRYTADADTQGWLKQISIYSSVAAPSTEVEVWIVEDPLGSPRSNFLAKFNTPDVGWYPVAVGQGVVSAGAQFDIFMYITNSGGGSLSFTGDYNYSIANTTPDPTSGEIHHQTNQTEIRISRDDDTGTDRSSDLANMEAGDEITLGGITWTITEVLSRPSGGLNINVTPRSTETAGLYTVEFKYYLNATIPYATIANHYLGRPTRGLFSSTGSYGDVVENDNAYGVDVLFQQAVVSPDWDFLASGTGGGSGNGDITVSTFIGLSDVFPTTYTGQANKLVAVRGTEDGVEFIDSSGLTQDLQSVTTVHGSAHVTTTTIQHAPPTLSVESALLSDVEAVTSALLDGYVPFESTGLKNSNIYYDGVRDVGVGTTSLASISSSTSTLTLGSTNTLISGGVAFQADGAVKGYNYVSSDYILQHGLVGVGVQWYTNNVYRMQLMSATGNLLLNTQIDDATNKLQVAGSISATGGTSANWNTAYAHTTLTNNPHNTGLSNLNDYSTHSVYC
jgi:hypothetical protein